MVHLVSYGDNGEHVAQVQAKNDAQSLRSSQSDDVGSSLEQKVGSLPLQP